MKNLESNALVAVLHTEKLAIDADLKALGARMESDGALLKRLDRRHDMVSDMLLEYAKEIEHPAGRDLITITKVDLTAEQLEALKKPSGRVMVMEPAVETEVRAAAAKHGIDPDVAVAVAKIESTPAPRVEKPAPRPEGIPTNFEMVQTCLLAAGEDGLLSHQIVEAVAAAFWPGLLAKQITPEFYAYVSDGRLVRKKDGWLALTEKGRAFKRNNGPGASGGNPKMVGTVKESPQDIINREAAKRAGPPTPRQPPAAPSAPAPKPAEPAVAAPTPPASAIPPISTTDDGKREFAHGSRMERFTVKEWRVVAQLYHVMGKGFMPYNSIVLNALKGERSPPDPRLWCSDMAGALKDRLASIGLEMKEYPRQGYSMRELEV